MTTERLPLIDTEVLILVDDTTGSRWEPVIVIDWEDPPSEWFITKYEGEYVEFPLSAEGETWKRP